MKNIIFSKGYSFLLIILTLLLGISLNAQITEKFEFRTHKFQEKTIPYRMFVAEEYSDTTKYPLILTLHGSGSRGTDNMSQISKGKIATIWAETDNQNKNPCFVVSPQCPTESHWGFQSEILINLIDSLIVEFSIDTTRLYLTGTSMGGWGVFDLFEKYPHKFAAAVPMGGGWIMDVNQDFINLTPIWNFHGAKDNSEPVISSRRIFSFLDSIGIKSIYPESITEEALDFFLAMDVKYLYSEYEDGGHKVWEESYTNPKLIDWVFSQQLSLDQNHYDYEYKYAFDIYADKVVAKLGGDSLLLFSNINIPDNNQINVFAIVSNESESYKDSIQLFDDGNIVDSLEGDKLYSNIFQVPDFEDIFNVSISTIDKDSNNHYLKIPNYYYFTTINSVEINNYNLISLDSTNFTTLAEINFEITNPSKSKILKDVSIKGSYFQSTNFIIDDIKIYEFGDIKPGETVTSLQNMMFRFSTDTDIKFAFEIRSNDYHFWTDTLDLSDISSVVSIESENQISWFSLNQNYPNPFNPSTKISYSIPKLTHVSLKVFDVLGREVATLVNKEKSIGNYEVEFDATNLTSGVYFYKIQAGEFVETKKMVLLK